MFTDPRLCAAIVDRLTFGGNIIETGSDSFRLAHTRAKTNDQTQPTRDLGCGCAAHLLFTVRLLHVWLKGQGRPRGQPAPPRTLPFSTALSRKTMVTLSLNPLRPSRFSTVLRLRLD